jgi:hypothetical protein
MKITIKQVFHPPVTSSVLDQNIFLIAPFSTTFNLCWSVNLERQVSQPYATSGFSHQKVIQILCYLQTKKHNFMYKYQRV